MKKIRINELARELEVKAHEILDRLPELGVTEKKTHSSSIDEDVALKLRKYYGFDVPETVHENGDESPQVEELPEEKGESEAPPAAVTVPVRPAPAAPQAAEALAPPKEEELVVETPPARPAPAPGTPIRPPLGSGRPIHPPIGHARPEGAQPAPAAPAPTAPAAAPPM